MQIKFAIKEILMQSSERRLISKNFVICNYLLDLCFAKAALVSSTSAAAAAAAASSSSSLNAQQVNYKGE